jgi:cytoskeletal protein RodZ
MDKLNNNAEFSELGELFSSTRKKNGLSLHEVSEKLSIRSTILNDIEHGKFAHLKEGDCAAYAKYLGIDFDRVKAVRNLQIEIARLKGDGSGYSAVKIAIGMVTITLIIVVIMFLFCSSSDEEQQEVLEEQSVPSMEIKEEKPIEQHVSTTVIEATVTHEVSDDKVQVEVKEEVAQTIEAVVEDEVVVVGDNNVSTVVDTPVQIEKPVVSIEQEAPKSGVVIATEENKTNEVKSVAVEKKQETVKAKEVTENVVTQKTTETKVIEKSAQKEKVATKVSTTKDTTAKTVATKNTNKKKNVSNKTAQTTVAKKVSTVKSTGLKSGQIVNLADEMGQSTNKTKQNPNKQQIKKPDNSKKTLTPREMEIKKKADMVVITEAVTN